jgi:LacI family transcriptional regulator
MTRRAQSAASIKAVAAMAGVSIATVSRVVNGVANKASPETAARVRQAIAALDYRPASAGRALRQRTSRLVAALAANLANPAMAAVAASLEIALREKGLVMVLCDTHVRPELQDEYLREMLAQQARAIILLGAVDSPMLATMRGGSTPLVFVNRRDPQGFADAMFVGIDNVAAGRDVARHCLAGGMAQAAIIHGSLASSATRDRVEAIRATLGEAGHAVADELVAGPDGADHLAIGYAGAQALATRGRAFKVVVCTSDLIAFGARRFFAERRPDGGIPAIIGFDDSPLNPWIAPWLTSVRIPYQEYGTAIVDILAGGGPDRRPPRRLLAHQLVDRGASRAAAMARSGRPGSPGD